MRERLVQQCSELNLTLAGTDSLHLAGSMTNWLEKSYLVLFFQGTNPTRSERPKDSFRA